jgi:hypothetical protein
LCDNCSKKYNPNQRNHDLDSLGDLCDDDDDNDKMPDACEYKYTLNPFVADSSLDPDKDGFTNYQEYLRKSNPLVSDSISQIKMPWLSLLLDGGKLKVRRVYASGYEAGNPPHHTIDRLLSTRWSSKYDGQWIMYDLGSVKRIGYVKIAWYRGNLRTARFRIEVSNDTINWFPVYGGQSSGKTSNLQKYDFKDRNARLVRIVGYGNSENKWHSITEVEVYSD